MYLNKKDNFHQINEILFVLFIFLFFYLSSNNLPSETDIGFYGGWDQSILKKIDWIATITGNK